MIVAHLSKLSLHYWRPDFTPTQAKQMIADFLEDLAPYTTTQIGDACAAYRRKAANRFFPTPGMLIAEIVADVTYTPPPRRYGMPKPVYDAIPEGPRQFKTVAEILRKNGLNEQADAWEAKHQ